MQQQAWFEATPVQKVDHKGVAKREEQTPRGTKIRKDGGTPLLPPIGEDLDYLLGYMHRIGFYRSTGMGLVPLSASELAAWQNGSQTPLSSWEFQTLLDMSGAYLRALHEAEDPACPPPYGAPAQTIDRGAVAKGIKSLFGGLARAKKG